MNKDESHHNGGSFAEDAAKRLRVIERQTAEEAEPRDRRRRALRPTRQQQTAQHVDGCLQELVSQHAFDVAHLIERARREQRTEQCRTWGKRAAATLTLGAVLVGSIVLVQDERATHVTEGEPRLVHLQDGSRVELNVHSSIRERFSADARDLYLTQGEGIFKVRPDHDRPFRVHAGKAIFEAVGTQFDVKLADDRAVIAVVEGVVQLKPTAVPAGSQDAARVAGLPRITAGLSLTVDSAGRADAPKPIDVLAVTQWRQSLGIVFTDASFEEVADAFNRLNAPPKLVIEGDALRKRRFSIALDPENSQALLRYLRQDDRLTLVETGDQVIVRERRR